MASNAVHLETSRKDLPLKRSTRIEAVDPHYVEWDETTTPRLGRRESEPHSHQITYLFDVLTTNFPDDRTLWDLHHYFTLEGEEIDLQFDISFFRGYHIPYTLSSYRASDHDNRVPTMAVNVLSRSTFYKDIGVTVDRCYRLGIPVYVVFNPYLDHIRDYRAPFLRVYYRSPESEEASHGFYAVKELRTVSFDATGSLDPSKIIDVGSLLPFRLAIQQLSVPHQGNRPQYRLVLVHPTELELFKTQAEQERQRAEQERQRAEQERQRAEQERQRVEEAMQRVKELEEQLKRLKKDNP